MVSLADVAAEERDSAHVIADADSGAFRDSRRGAWLLTPELEARLAAAGDPALSPIREGARAETLARLAMSAAAADCVVFTHRTRDHDGSALAPA